MIVVDEYSTPEVARLTGLTKRQLEWLAEEHGMGPSLPAHGSGTRARYSEADLRRLLLLASLRLAGVEIGAAVAYLEGRRSIDELAACVTRVRERLRG